MKNIMNFIKDKIYYIFAGTIILIVLLVIISACSNKIGSNYNNIEKKMVEAARSYYNERQEKLPKEDGGSVKVTIGTLIDAELIKEIKDPKNKEQTCDGFVQVKRVENDYAFIPFLTCKGNYEPKYLTDAIKESKQDEYGNGVYEMNGEYVYRGDDVNNYVTFNNQTWRIIKIDTDNTIELVYYQEKNNARYSWDTDYNSEIGRNYGITTDYLHSDIRKSLVEFYETNFTDESKAHIVSKNICIGKKALDAKENAEAECSVVKENEKIGLLRVSDYPKASLDEGCLRYDYDECSNRNYFSSSGISTWLLTTVSDNTYQVYLMDGANIVFTNASKSSRINPVIYLDSDVVIISGNGTVDNPYLIKY